MEAGTGTGAVRGTYENVSAVRTALETAGVIFTEADDVAGPGVRLKK
jgi:hypothetical protein